MSVVDIQFLGCPKEFNTRIACRANRMEKLIIGHRGNYW